MVKSKLNIFLSGVISTSLLLLLIIWVFSFSRNLLKLEIFGILFLTILVFLGLSSSKNGVGSRILFFVSLFSLTNLVLLWKFFMLEYWTLVFLSVLLMLFNFPERKCNDNMKNNFKSPAEPPDSSNSSTEHSVVFDSENNQNIKQEFNEKEVIPKKSKTSKPKTISSRKKFVASKRSTIYHDPKCEWAKKINPKGKRFFASKEDAWENGYKSHNCVE